jgi:ligand-binding sensor domain-containing protein
VKNNAWILKLSYTVLLLTLAACFKGQENGVRPNGNAALESSIEVRSTGAVALGQLGLLQPETTQVSQYIRRMFQDEAGNIWFGTNDDGVVRYDGKSFRNFTARGGLPDDDVWSLLLDRSGILWIGTASGVSRYDGNTFSSFEIPEANITGHAASLMWSIAEDRDGNIWFGSNGRGVFRYDGTNITRFSRQDGLGSDIVQTIVQDRAGVLWFGTRDGGLSRYDGIAFAHSPMGADADGGYVWTMLEDRAGLLWVSLLGDGLYRHDGKSFTHYSTADGLGNTYVQSILEDRDGTLWVGTSGGMYRFNGKTFSNFTREDAGRKP